MSFQRGWLSQVALATVLACLARFTSAGAAPGPGKGYERIPPGAYSVFAEVRAKPYKSEELRSVTMPLIQLVRSDPKNLMYFFQEDRDTPGHLMFYEVWATQADFEAHNNMPYVKEWFSKLPALADGGVKTTRMRILPDSAR